MEMRSAVEWKGKGREGEEMRTRVVEMELESAIDIC
jgi:hypothetical protein